jgi:hypothetical protein
MEVGEMNKRISLWRPVFRIALTVIVAVSLLLGVVPMAQSAVYQSSNDPAVKAGAGDVNAYAFTIKNVDFTGWKTIKGQPVYYLVDKKANGLVVVGKKVYYFKKGVSQKGWQKVNGKQLYFKKAAKGKYALSKSKVRSDFAKVTISYPKLVKRYYKNYVRYDRHTVKQKKAQFYFNQNGALYKGSVKNARVLKAKDKLYYVNPSGAVNNSKKILSFDKFSHGGWLRVWRFKINGGTVVYSLTRFGSKKLTGDKQKDAEAFALYRQCLKWDEDFEKGRSGKLSDSELAAQKQQFAALLSYDWLKYTAPDPYMPTTIQFTGDLEMMGALMARYFKIFYPDLYGKYIISYSGGHYCGKEINTPYRMV